MHSRRESISPCFPKLLTETTVDSSLLPRKIGPMADLPSFHNLDRIDCSLVRLLQAGGRASFAELGKAVGLSATSAAERVRRLEHSGIIEGYGARVCAAKLGYPVSAFILARPKGTDARYIKVAKVRPEILGCHRVTGEFSFIMNAVVRDVGPPRRTAQLPRACGDAHRHPDRPLDLVRERAPGPGALTRGSAADAGGHAVGPRRREIGRHGVDAVNGQVAVFDLGIAGAQRHDQ